MNKLHLDNLHEMQEKYPKTYKFAAESTIIIVFILLSFSSGWIAKLITLLIGD